MNIQIIKNKSKKIKSRRVLGNRKKNSRNLVIFFLCLVFIIAIVIGTFYFKTLVDSNYFEENLNILENMDLSNINRTNLFLEVLFRNIIVLIFMWIVGLSVLGVPVLIFYIFYDGFSLGVTLTYILNTYGFIKGYSYIFKSMYLVSLINTAVIILLCNSAIKVTINILNQKTNIKCEFIRHSIACIIMLIVLIFSSILEVYLANLIK